MALIAAFVLGGALNSGASVWTNLAGGNASGTWGAAANWSGGIPNGTDAVADFSTLAVTANSMITNDAARTIGTLLFAGTAPGNDWTVTGSPLTLAVSSGTPAIVVGNQAASIATALTGSQGFTKGGAGILELTGTNAYGGATVVTNGTLQLAGALTMPSGTVGFWQFNKGGLHLTQAHPTGCGFVRRSVGMSMGLSARPVRRGGKIAGLGISMCDG